jgi:hypothetical protein
MSYLKRRPLGRDDYVTFLRSSPKLGLAVAALVGCLLAGLIMGVTDNTPEAGLVGGSLLLLGVALLADVSVKFYQWARSRPR